jgi:Arc/MetJ-type ribon-helix-helix transcriptional regulator
MAQLNLNVTAEFDAALKSLMRSRGIRSKSEAIRIAVQETAQKCTGERRSFSSWLGMANQAPVNPRPRFSGDDDLWD